MCLKIAEYLLIMLSEMVSEAISKDEWKILMTSESVPGSTVSMVVPGDLFQFLVSVLPR